MNPSEIYSGFNLSFDQGIAEKLGVDAALVFNHIIYWLRINANKPDIQMIKGRYWMFETQKQMAEFFGFLTEDQVNKALKKLIDSGLIIKDNFNKNPFDRTGWYSVYDQKLIKKCLRNPEIGGIENPDSAECIPPISRNQIPPYDGMHTPDLAECIYTTEETETKKTDSESKTCTVAVSSDSVSSVKSKICESLKILGADDSFLKWMFRNFDLQKIIQACKYYNDRMDKIDISNPMGYIRLTLTEGWV